VARGWSPSLGSSAGSCGLDKPRSTSARTTAFGRITWQADSYEHTVYISRKCHVRRRAGTSAADDVPTQTLWPLAVPPCPESGRLSALDELGAGARISRVYAVHHPRKGEMRAHTRVCSASVFGDQVRVRSEPIQCGCQFSGTIR